MSPNLRLAKKVAILLEPRYSIPFAYLLRGPNLQLERLLGALRGLIERHEVLRSVLHEDEDGQLLQGVLDVEPLGSRKGRKTENC